ncbi:DCC1-like thiol-disulfide oxidoreductase family protein [Halomonas sp. PR-M31]|uniref:DCC1-like thiol-disulfide oxidoreductase family protein n=1 Tax=Halomonas sp. PR-M31 TaxID=1471202 RepID=UPI0006522E7D|nr:DCC1-like thiol-disulfide oxidoreductase family protein [Halomonas sp. PR-M31]
MVYDGQCPFCANYVRLVRLQGTIGRLQLVDAREKPSAVNEAILDEIRRAGLDIDQGMVLKLDGQLYHGDEAMHRVALLSSRSGIFNRLNYWVFRSPRRARLLYPPLRSIRNIVIKGLGREPIDNLGRDSDASS